MAQILNKPYCSFCMCLRNDNYGGDQQERFKNFIVYYSQILKKYKNIFEFVICDYNSPKKNYVHKMHLPWSRLHPIKFIVVTENDHARFSKGIGRQMLDYVGRNIAVRSASGEFICILNQDIFISDSILKIIAQKNLNKELFYRADRWDFEKTKSTKHNNYKIFLKIAEKNTFLIHRRHNKDQPISSFVKNKQKKIFTSSKLKNEKTNTAESLILSNKQSIFSKVLNKIKRNLHFEDLGLHTNACGDFVLCSKEAWTRIRGAPETTDFYMHTDSYILAQLFSNGFRQCIFKFPHKIFHADHDRVKICQSLEKIPYVCHQKKLKNICCSVRRKQYNDKNWGMSNYNLKSIKL